MKITAASSYNNTIQATCTITVTEDALNLDACSILGLEESYPYTGKPISPAFEIRHGDFPLCEGPDYSISIQDNTMPGIAMITITGTGLVTGTIERTFIILPDATTREKPFALSLESADNSTKITFAMPEGFSGDGTQVIAARYEDRKMMETVFGTGTPGEEPVTFPTKIEWDQGWKIFFLRSEDKAPLCPPAIVVQ